MKKKLLAEAAGTFWLVLGGCGSAVLATGFPDIGIGFAGVALAFGLSVLTMIYALGQISGGHFNPAVSVGLCAGGRFPVRDVPFYILAQVAGGLLGAGVLYLIATGSEGFNVHAGFASNGFGELSQGGFTLQSVALTEWVLTGMFVMVIMGVTRPGAAAGMAPAAIGMCLTLIHLISIPVDNTSVNPARSTAVAVFAGGEWLSQLWLFWVAPLAGGLCGGLLCRLMSGADTGICQQE
ncbi:aquaporin Z [Enterobacter hormaechei]|uniref:aquaporin Z n=1 Tax=Enterobacter hormaechei TaxID=158836 RepID=UPI0032DB1B92